MTLWISSHLKVLYDLMCSYFLGSTQQGVLCYATTLLRFLVDHP